MFSAAGNLIQNQMMAPLSFLASQSSVGARPSTRPALASSKVEHNSSKLVARGSSKNSPGNSQHPSTDTKKNAVVESSTDASSTTNSPNLMSILLPSLSKPAIPSESSSSSSNLNNIDEPAFNSMPENCGRAAVSESSLFSSQQERFDAGAGSYEKLQEFLEKSSSARLLNLCGVEQQDAKQALSRAQQIVPVSHLQSLVNDVCEEISRRSSCSRKDLSLWCASHVSNNSFLENKHSSSTSPPAPTAAAGSITSIIASRLHLLLRHTSNTVLSGMAVRGFKTVRTIDQDTSRNTSVRDRFRGKTAATTTTTTTTTAASAAQQAVTKNSKMKILLSESGAGEQQLKLAFAEGYLASDGGAAGAGSAKGGGSRGMRWLKNFQQMLAIVVLLAVLASVMSTMGGSLFRMNVTNGNEVHPEEITVSFDDVRGVEEAKQELEEIVEFLRCPEKFTSLGAELPKGVLLVGPPGTGKTLLARAVAGEAGVPFFHAAGPEFDEILVGQGARRVRDLFRAAKNRAPCVIFIDEIDSVGAKRTNSVLHPYANQTINQLLAEMDGFHKNEGVIVLGATNRRDDLDKALLRPGRFDVEIQVSIPDLAGRREMFEYYLGKVKMGPDVEVGVLARGTTGFTGADIKNVVNQAALRAAADLVDCVTMKHFEAARDKVLMGPEKKSRIPDEEVNMVTAYHEGGHTLVAHYTKHSHPLHKVTIIPRGPSLGHTAYIPAKEQYNVTRAQMMATLDSLMGGRAAEELIFGPELVTSGASSDLKQATSVATHMVKDFGMSERVGLRTFEDTSGQLLGGGDSLSTSTLEAIDAEIKRLLQESYERARTILRTHAKEHKALAEALLKYETLDAADIKAILDGRSMSKEG
uniref:ATP-dependent zinc metalloprotease YME1 homolog n=2 Tax=Hirondellea gigas TaxID=1518452 RepID=A0A2P2I4B5_9CRUS